MKTYRFYIDSKSTIWLRNHYEVYADNKKEALKYIKEEFNDPTFEDQDGVSTKNKLKGINFYENEILYDTAESLEPEENDGCHTKELYETGKLKCLKTNL